MIELLVVLAILVILVAIVLSRLGTFGKQANLEATTQQILSTLKLARAQTLGSEGETVYGVHFETSKYTFFKGSTYDAADTTNKDYPLTATEIYEINLNAGASEVVFTRVRGTTTQNGNVKIRLLDDTSRTQTILINSSGQASEEASVSTSGTRVTDSRHLHFDPCPSIQTSTTLTLIFSDPPNPNVTKNVAMASYFNADKTAFGWEDETDVNGDKQTIKVHTHFLDSSSSIISIHRDKRLNDKAVDIRIDGVSIISYTATGTESLGTFCSDYEIQ